MCLTPNELGSVHHKPPLEVVVHSELELHHTAASKLIAKFPNTDNKATLLVYFAPDGVELRSTEKPHHKGFKVDFSGVDRRVGVGNLSTKQQLPKSLGKHAKTILDGTGGFCADAVRLVLMGYTVTAVERSLVISTLVEDGLRRAVQDTELWHELRGRFTFIHGDLLKGIPTIFPHDVVYLDPMFPPKRKKSALPPGPIQLIQTLVGYDNDLETNALFQVAMKLATQRVVVKRPTYSPPLNGTPIHVHEGKLVRYEVYKPT